MNHLRSARCAAFLMVMLVLCGCSSISENTRAYIGSPHVPPTQPGYVRILQAVPTEPHTRLGEVLLNVEGQPSRDAVEKRLREGAARLGADAVVVVADRMHIFPVVYYDWWGPSTVSQDVRRNIVGVAIKYNK